MKKIFYITFSAIAVLSSCTKENGESADFKDIDANTITAYIDNSATKTIYNSETDFQWLDSDVIGLQVYNSSTDKYDKWNATSTSAGSSATFTHTDMGAWAVSNWAFYPKNQNGNIDCSYSNEETPKVTLSYNITPSGHKNAGATAMSCIPLIGKNQGGDNFRFTTATGILKISVINIPAEVTSLRVEVQSMSGKTLSGTFPITESGGDYYITSATAESGQYYKYINTSSVSVGQNDFYFPLPEVSFAKRDLKIALYSAQMTSYNSGWFVDYVMNPRQLDITHNVLMETPVIDASAIFNTVTYTGVDYAHPKITIAKGDGVSYVKYAVATTKDEAPSAASATRVDVNGDVILSPSKAGNNYVYYWVYDKDDHTMTSGKHSFVYLTDTPEGIAQAISGEYHIGGIDNQWVVTIASVDTPVDGKNVKITRYQATTTGYDWSGQECYGTLNPAAGTITFNSGQAIDATHYLCGLNASPGTGSAYNDTFVFSVVFGPAYKTLSFNNCFAVVINVDPVNKTCDKTGQHFNNQTMYSLDDR